MFSGGSLVFLLKDSPLLHLFLFFYMGVLNGMFIFYKDVVVRTTHVTGYLTDAGFELGAALRGGSGHGWKILFYLGSLGLFFWVVIWLHGGGKILSCCSLMRTSF